MQSFKKPRELNGQKKKKKNKRKEDVGGNFLRLEGCKRKIGGRERCQPGENKGRER